MAAALQASVAGLGAVFAWPEFGLLALGVLVGALVGILPGLGGSATLAMLLPFTLGLPPSQSFALLIGVAAVVATTGDLTSILVGIPGEPIAAATVVDGHPMAMRGEAERAIGASLFSSLAGSIGGAAVIVLTMPLALPLARHLGSPELFMLAVWGIACVAPLANGSPVRGLAAGAMGLMLATVGLDPMTSTPRFTFGQLSLWDGVGAIPVALGLFAVPEIVALAASTIAAPHAVPRKRSRILDGVFDVVRRWRLVLRSSVIGAALGVVPGIGANVSQWVAYASAARRPAERERFGEGAIEGVIAPSAANNATLGGSLVPALALGIPGGLLSAFLLSALIMKGFAPGPTLLLPEVDGGHLTFVFTLIWLLVAANVLAVGLACLGTGVLVHITRVPAARLVPFLLLLTFVGAFAERQAIADLVLTTVMAALGLTLVRFGWPRAPLLMGLVLGPLAENRLFLSLDAYGASWLWRPGVLIIAAAIAVTLVVPRRRSRADGASSKARAVVDGRGEQLFVAVIAATMIAALVASASYSSKPALFPRAAAVATLAALLAVLVSRQGMTRQAGSQPTATDAGRDAMKVAAWLPVFVTLIWAFGFVAGAPLGVLTYLTVSGEKLWRAGVAAGATSAFLYLVLYRLLQVPFPPGVVVAWAGGGL